MHKTIPISKFEATCLRLLDTVNRTGRSILVTHKGEPTELVTPPPRPKRWLGRMQDRIKSTGDTRSPILAARNWEALRD